MLTNQDKTSTLWKHYKGWGSTHAERETFEELYRSYNQISTNSVLTYGDLLPRLKTDRFYEDVRKLDSTVDTVYYEESSFKRVPLVKKYTNLKLTKISSNCNHAFAILNENGQQIKNIIPFDFSDTGLYNIVLKNADNEEIVWGSCDWIIDTNSSLLTFNNGVPAGISAENPPSLTFYQYVGPVGERHYVDAVLFDIRDIDFAVNEPVKDFTSQASAFLENIETGFFKTHGFNGTDNTQGIGLQYNVLTNVIDTTTNDPVRGYDDNSQAQVISLLSHKVGETTNATVKFVSEGIPEGKHTVEVADSGEYNGIVKVNTDDGFFVLQAEPGTYDIVVKAGETVSAVLLVKDNKTLDYELFYPRSNLKLTVKLPVFVDLMKLPPHLKLTSLASYTDHITPQYYGPRTVDFVVASDPTSVNSRAADFIVYNREGFYLQNALNVVEGTHVLFRNGTYKNDAKLILDSSLVFSGETKQNTFFTDLDLSIEAASFIENITFKNCTILVKAKTTFKNCIFDNNTKVTVTEDAKLSVFEKCNLDILDVKSNVQIFDSTFTNINVTEADLDLYNSPVAETLKATRANVSLYSSFINTFENEEGKFYINTCRIATLNVVSAAEGSVVNTTNIDYVEFLPDTVKIDSSYVTTYSEKVTRRVYPDEATIPYYSTFNKRVYAKLPDPFLYNEETNQLTLKLDSVEHTIYINENGELQTRFFTSKEISLTAPETYETQIEHVYGEHADTKLETEKPTTLEEALIDLYWSKADLKNGKVPIDQLPDSVAYGGLQMVGMWSFEDHNGEYPTFADCDTSFASDDEYTDLQNGWFFIVSASHKEDDPVYPQTAVDGTVYTAGDWVIYSGGKKIVTKEVDWSKATTFKVGDYFVTNKNMLATLVQKDLYQVLTESTLNDASDETLGGIIIKDGQVNTLIDVAIPAEVKEAFITGQEAPIDAITDATYTETVTISATPFEKLDRAYLDPVYSRLPELATKTGDENPEWSVEDGGTGLLRLSYKTLAEAIRFINDALLKLSPDRPSSIQELSVVVDSERTTAREKEYIKVGNGLQLNQLVQLATSKAWDGAENTKIFFKLRGARESLPLENIFYCGLSSDIRVWDNEANLTDDCDIPRFDPYKEYRLGFRFPTFIDAADVKGYVQLGKGAFAIDHNVKVTQYNLEKSPFVTDPVETFEGETTALNIKERKFYDLADTIIQHCESETLNTRVLTNLMSENRTGGIGYLPTGTKVTATSVIKNFTKYGTIGPDAKVQIRATFADIELDTVLTNQYFELTNSDIEAYDLNAGFTVTLPNVEYARSDLKVELKVCNFGHEIDWTTVLLLKDLIVVAPETIPTIVEPAGSLLYPTLGKVDSTKQFGADYKVKTYGQAMLNCELMYEEDGFRWPLHSQYIEKPGSFEDSEYIDTSSGGINVNEKTYRFVTFKYDLSEIHDICGFNLKLLWNDIKPLIDSKTGIFENVLLQICVNSTELESTVLLDGNSPVPVFFEATLEQAEPCNYPGKSDESVRRITFGRKPIPVKTIYVRIGLEKNSGLSIKGIDITED